ncbi:type II toxin-antitoxin system VapC family toxin [Salipiger thiooxidans]|uniref:type II toxin-antitoxin system VapC family toxin n=1 Tax=Salipiger thiooxidans TaxID=282683 RepID=UPI001CD71103|nr:type II toxin-antitoxin system VapC family toxin [Salipiger thiooxidans]MCA0848724.1 type II toxin-antitoxin system VapC family toxin [Salipiger thiooxidans]
MIHILDTNVISAVRRADRAPQVARWLGAQAETDLYLSVVTLGEIERGIRLQEPRNPDFARDLRLWLERTVTVFADRLLEFDAADAMIWGELSARLGHNGADLMIAAQALARDAAVVTGNVSDFEPTGARVVNPFD